MHQTLPTIQDNTDYTAIINGRHYQRLVSLLQDARNKGAKIISLAPEGEVDFDVNSRKIAPHLVLNVTKEMVIMQEEIFGPLLPIKTYSGKLDDAIAMINAEPRPQAAYYFGNTEASQQKMIKGTTSGALVINDVMTHASLDSQGMGAYHGIHGFRRFSHTKPVVIQNQEGTTNLRLRAPYQDNLDALKAVFTN